MGISRSTYYETTSKPDDTAIVEAMAAIWDEFEHYGWRRVRAALRHQGMVVNHKKIKRLMRQHDFQSKSRQRPLATTDSDHDDRIFPNKAKGMTVDGPNQLGCRTSPTSGYVYECWVLPHFACWIGLYFDAGSRRDTGFTSMVLASCLQPCCPSFRALFRCCA